MPMSILQTFEIFMSVDAVQRQFDEIRTEVKYNHPVQRGAEDLRAVALPKMKTSRLSDLLTRKERGMRRILMVFLLLIPCAAISQEKPVEKKTNPAVVKPAKKPVIDKNFCIASAVLTASTVYDLETTFAGIKNGAREGNPLMRPIVNAGRPVAYPVNIAIDTGIMYLSYRYKKKGNSGWWLLPVVVTVGHTVAGSLNLRFVF